jgi:SAM-dependent methyltransferase
MSRVRALRDQAIADDVRDLLDNYRGLQNHELSVSVDGGIAHVAGWVPSQRDRQLVRQLIGRVRGIRGVWDVIRIPGEDTPCVMDIGCGNHKQHAWAIGVDRYPYPAVNVITQIERGLPFADRTVDQVFAVHVLEHVQDLLGVMNEIHRILKPDGVLHVMVPHWEYVNAVADPTHVRFFHAQTFKFFCRPYPDQRLFRPLAISTAPEDLVADLQPVQDGEPPPPDEVLCRFFD